MVLYVKDEETSALVRRLAKLRGVGITAAIREAASEAIEADLRGAKGRKHLPLRERLEPFFERIDALPRVPLTETSKEAFDKLWDED